MTDAFAAVGRRARKKRLPAGQWILLMGFALVVVVNMFPIVWMISTSVKGPDELFSEEVSIIPKTFSLESYRIVFEEYSLMTWYVNSVLSTAGISVLQVLVSLLAAFGIRYYRAKWNKAAFYFIIITMVVPFQVTMIPNYITVNSLGLKDRLGALILPCVANASTFFYLYQSLKSIPRDYYEVARVEGGNSFQVFRHVAMGLSRGAISAIAVLTVIDSWNQYFWPMLVLTKAESRTMTIALRQFLDFEMGNRWGPFMATATLASLPVIIAYLFFQRNIINAFISAGIKG